jgi:hypothetical protein
MSDPCASLTRLAPRAIPDAVRLPQLGREGDAWPGLTIAGIVILAAAVVADAFGDPPWGGPRLVVGLIIGFAVLVVGYAMRRRETRRPPES